MSELKIRVVYVPTDTVNVEGQPRHYFETEKGKYRAIFIDNLPKKEKNRKSDKK